MLILSIFLIAAGLIMIIKPDLIWTVGESWKSEGATEPSSLYLWSTRFGGAMCALAGIGGIIASVWPQG
jgi:hypothetical protein